MYDEIAWVLEGAEEPAADYHDEAEAKHDDGPDGTDTEPAVEPAEEPVVESSAEHTAKSTRPVAKHAKTASPATQDDGKAEHLEELNAVKVVLRAIEIRLTAVELASVRPAKGRVDIKPCLTHGYNGRQSDSALQLGQVRGTTAAAVERPLTGQGSAAGAPSHVAGPPDAPMAMGQGAHLPGRACAADHEGGSCGLRNPPIVMEAGAHLHTERARAADHGGVMGQGAHLPGRACAADHEGDSCGLRKSTLGHGSRGAPARGASTRRRPRRCHRRQRLPTIMGPGAHLPTGRVPVGEVPACAA